MVGTGITGLDDILGGGLPPNRLYLVEGSPGSGKTSLALQFLMEGRDRGDAGVYVTLSETMLELSEVAASHGWSLDGISMLDSTVALETPEESQYTVFHPSEVELEDTVERILARIDEVAPKRVVLDSLSDVRLLARDPLRFRRQVLALKQFFAGRGITVLLLDDKTADDPDMQLHSLVHGVVGLEQLALAHGAERRQLRVSKLRAVSFHGGYHDFVIRSGGLAVFPRIRLGTEAPPVRAGVAASGSEDIDTLTGGGFPSGTSVLFTGAPGTGKSVLVTQYAVAAAERGDPSVIYLFDERGGTFAERAASLRMNLAPHLATGLVTLVPLEPTEISPGEFTSRVVEAVAGGARLVAIDSLNGFNKAMPEELQLTVKMHELLSYLGSRSVTTLVTLAQRGILGAPPGDAADVSYLSDAVVLLRYFESRGEVRRAISIFKQRSSDHERTIREFRLGPGGLQLGQPLREFHGVLTGVPTFTGPGGELLAGARGSDALADAAD